MGGYESLKGCVCVCACVCVYVYVCVWVWVGGCVCGVGGLQLLYNYYLHNGNRHKSSKPTPALVPPLSYHINNHAAANLSTKRVRQVKEKFKKRKLGMVKKERRQDWDGLWYTMYAWCIKIVLTESMT